jgi:hypothetical protein
MIWSDGATVLRPHIEADLLACITLDESRVFLVRREKMTLAELAQRNHYRKQVLSHRGQAIFHARSAASWNGFEDPALD